MEEYVNLLTKLQKDYQKLEDLRSNNIKEHEKVYNSSECVRLLILQQEQVFLNKIEEEQYELKRQLTTLQDSNQISLQEGISKIDQRQEQILLLCSELQTLINSEGKHTDGREIQKQIAKLFSKDKSFNITLKKPQFVPRLHQGLKLGEIVSEEQSIQFSFSLCQSGEVWSPVILGQQKGNSVVQYKVEAGNATLSDSAECTTYSAVSWQNPDCSSTSQNYTLSENPSNVQDALGFSLQDGMEGEVNWKGTDGEILNNKGTVLHKSSQLCSNMLASGNKIPLKVADHQTTPFPNTEKCSLMQRENPGGEDYIKCGPSAFLEKGTTSASWLDGECVPLISPNELEKLDMLKERVNRDPSMIQDIDIHDSMSCQSPGVQSSSLSSQNRNELGIASVTSPYTLQIQRDQQQINSNYSVMRNQIEPALASQTITSPTNSHEVSSTQIHRKTCVPFSDLNNSVSQFHRAVTRNEANQSNPTKQQECLEADSTVDSSQTETSQPTNHDSLYRVTAAFIFNDDAEDLTFIEHPIGMNMKAMNQTKENDPELCRAQAIKASHVPSALQRGSLKMSHWTSMNSISKARSKHDWGNIAASDTETPKMNRRFKMSFSKSCLDLSANDRPIIPDLRTFNDPEQNKLKHLSQRSFSSTESLDSSSTFLVNSPRSFEERKKMPSRALKPRSASKSLQHHSKGKYQPHFTKTVGCETNEKGSSQIRNSRGGSPIPARRLRTNLNNGSFPNSKERPSFSVDKVKSPSHHRMSHINSSEFRVHRSQFQPKVTRKPENSIRGDGKISLSPMSQFSFISDSGASAKVAAWMKANDHYRREKSHSSLAASKAWSKSEANLSCQVQRGAHFFKNVLVEQFGKFGCGQTDLNLPYGIHTTPQGAMYVVDYGNKRLKAMDRKGNVTQQIRLERGTYFDISVSSQGLLALSNISNKSLDIYSKHGKLLSIITEDFQNPRGITVNVSDQFLITDTKQGTISVLTLDPQTAQKLDSKVVSGFNKPYFISINSSERVAVSERGFDGGCCVKVLDRDLQVLHVLGSTKSSLTTELSNPWGVCIDEQDNVLVADWRHKHSIILFSPLGPASLVVESGLSSPRGLGLVQDGHIAVVDSMHNCIKVFRYR
ncbi:uncharacterized protein [Chiloscyllium punctatum]|uniref:E3 ubiquitin-protein ligase TRIM32 n=1 Tax=Chiloscyllium punctatum TaxID=137246 RepID=A0A401RIW8_CHIPU|nr:hypothetical protein [Chiloscyllium punctatum]